MPILESLVHRIIQIAVIHLVGLHPWRRLCELLEFATKVLTLLVGALGRGWERGKFGVDLQQQLV